MHFLFNAVSLRKQQELAKVQKLSKKQANGGGMSIENRQKSPYDLEKADQM